MTADIPRQPTAKDIDAVRALIQQGVLCPSHRRWHEMEDAASALGLRPADAIYHVREAAPR